MALLTLTDAKDHLKITDADHDAVIGSKLDDAQGVIADYMKKRWDPTWDVDTLPRPVRAAILIMLGNLYENIGDDQQARDQEAWNSVIRLLDRLRDPAYA